MKHKDAVLALAGAAALSLVSFTPVVVAQDHSAHTASTSLVQTVRQATARFQNVAAARPAGYAPFAGCVSGPEVGAMGVHYVNGKLVGDGRLDAQHPEALIYERSDGQLHLVGVEYIVIADAWDRHNGLPPALGGQVFQYVNSPNRYRLPAFYELHVWAWKANRNGAFVDWNPAVSCTEFTQ